MESRPDWLMDVGSTALLVGILSTTVPVMSVELRPLPVNLPGLSRVKATVTALPFEDGTVPMVSSLSVVEHVGLGRYGDELDVDGSERAIRELARVLRSGGRLLLSVPITNETITMFNMHRLLNPKEVIAWLENCELESEMTIAGSNLMVWCTEWVKK